MHVIGTAGHVDHGKSTLIAALTGTHPDRLKEEQEREMTIELGFAWLTLPGGEEIGIVDMPGHRDFIDNMLAGVGGIDAVLLVIAADEGVMPQTREHLAILDLLQVHAGIVVLTKVDMIDDPEWLNLIETDIRMVLAGTILANAPLVRVSGRTKAGLTDLVDTLSSILQNCPSRPDLGRPRLPVDRIFSVPGFGTVVTGTLLDGTLNQGEEVEILPGGSIGRIRGLQGHKKKEGSALPGSRTAVNISGLNVEQVRRGDVVVHPGQYRSTRMLDVHFHLLPDARGPLKHASEIKLFIAASESIARVRLLGVEILEPGQTGWLQLELNSAVVAVRGDRFILRRPSPSETLGGGSILDPQPQKRHKRFSDQVLKEMQSLTQGSPTEVLLHAALALGPAPLKEIVLRSRLDPDCAQPALQECFINGQLIALEPGDLSATSDQLVLPRSSWDHLRTLSDQMIRSFHQNQPLKAGMPREELKSRLKLSNRLFNSIMHELVRTGDLVEIGTLVRKPGFTIYFNPGQQAQIKNLWKRFSESPFSPPSIKECQAEISGPVYEALVNLGELKPVSDEVVFRSLDYETLVARVIQHIQQNGQITVAEARDLFKTSRRYVLSLLEYLDTIGVTFRDGEFRHLKR